MTAALLATQIVDDFHAKLRNTEHMGEENPFYEGLIGFPNSFGPGNIRQPFQR
jgi:hypothetical protein